MAFLVYPHGALREMDYGVSATGCRTWVFLVRIDRLEADLGRILQTTSLKSSSGPVNPPGGGE